MQLLVSMGYDPNYGARSVKRIILLSVENKFQGAVLRGDYEEENTVLVSTNLTAVVWDNLPLQKLSFHKLLIPKVLAVESEADSYASAKDGLCRIVCKVLD